MLTDASEARVCSRCSIGMHEIVNCWSRKDGHDLGLQTRVQFINGRLAAQNQKETFAAQNLNDMSVDWSYI
jgi:hypothetical protein